MQEALTRQDLVGASSHFRPLGHREGMQAATGCTSAHVVWRLGGGRAVQTETFSIGTDEQNLARAEGFKKMVEAAGGHWPKGWVKGEGFVRARGADAHTPPPTFSMLGLEYVDQIVDLSPGQRRRYRDQIGVLARTEVRVPCPSPARSPQSRNTTSRRG
jgi:hypothetical protein